jgi:hypothetical protein
MMAAFSEDRDHVTADDLRSAIEELNWPEYAQRRSNTGSQEIDTSDTGRFRTDATFAGLRQGPKLYVAPPTEDVVLGRITVRRGNKESGELPLHLGKLVVGRTPDNDLQLDNRFVSRHHCQIITTREYCFVEDEGSTNGIRMEGKRVKRRRLRNGDVISIGHYDIVYSDERPEKSASAGSDSTEDADVQAAQKPGQEDLPPGE